MPEFEYLGVDRAGKKVKGKFEAPGEGEVRMILRGQGVRPTRISKVGLLNADLGSMMKGGGGANIGLEQLVTFTRQLQVLISSGIPVVQGLDILAEQAPERGMRFVLSAIKEKVSAGNFLWEALNQYPKAFPKIYVSLVRAGEASGSLDQILKRLSRYLEDADRLRRTLKSAMMYPIIVTGIGIGVIALMMIFVIPRFETLIIQAGQDLPLPTKIVLDISHFMVRNILKIMAGAIVSGVLLKKYLSSPEGKAVIDRAFFRAPLFGNLMQKGGVARFSRTMQTLLMSGVNLIDAIDICKATINNSVLETAVAKIRAEVESGKTLGSVLVSLKVFPNMAVQMISVGESTGSLDKMLEKVADFYEEEVETIVGGLTKLIEPLVLVILGGAVGGLMVAMYLPIFKIAGAS